MDQPRQSPFFYLVRTPTRHLRLVKSEPFPYDKEAVSPEHVRAFRSPNVRPCHHTESAVARVANLYDKKVPLLKGRDCA